MPKGKPTLRKHMLSNLLGMYEHLNEKHIPSSTKEIQLIFNLIPHYVNILSIENIISVVGSRRNGYSYKWIGIRPSIHMVNALCDKLIATKHKSETETRTIRTRRHKSGGNKNLST